MKSPKGVTNRMLRKQFPELANVCHKGTSDTVARLLLCENFGDIFLDQILSGNFASNDFPQIFDFIGGNRSAFARRGMVSGRNRGFGTWKKARLFCFPPKRKAARIRTTFLKSKDRS